MKTIIILMLAMILLAVGVNAEQQSISPILTTTNKWFNSSVIPANSGEVHRVFTNITGKNNPAYINDENNGWLGFVWNGTGFATNNTILNGTLPLATTTTDKRFYIVYNFTGNYSTEFWALSTSG